MPRCHGHSLRFRPTPPAPFEASFGHLCKEKATFLSLSFPGFDVRAAGGSVGAVSAAAGRELQRKAGAQSREQQTDGPPRRAGRNWGEAGGKSRSSGGAAAVLAGAAPSHGSRTNLGLKNK